MDILGGKGFMAEATYDVSNALSTINKNLGTINDNVLAGVKEIEVVHGTATNVNSNLKVVYDEVGQLAQDFHDYVQKAENQHNLALAETRLIKPGRSWKPSMGIMRKQGGQQSEFYRPMILNWYARIQSPQRQRNLCCRHRGIDLPLVLLRLRLG